MERKIPESSLHKDLNYDSAFTEFTVTNIFSTKRSVLIPIVHPVEVFIRERVLENYSSFCGAGSGLGDLIVPETIFGVRVSPACFVHDQMFDKAKPLQMDLLVSNAVFMTNLNSLIVQMSRMSKFNPLYHLRMYRMTTYFDAVNTIGSEIFWKLKRRQFDEA